MKLEDFHSKEELDVINGVGEQARSENVRAMVFLENNPKLFNEIKECYQKEDFNLFVKLLAGVFK